METDPSEIEKLSLKETVGEVLQESRMVLPGIQALFGFQLIAFFNNAFGELSSFNKIVHFLALALTIVAIGLLMAPAAYHRQVERQTVSRALVCYATRLINIGMAPLALSISLDVYVVTGIALKNSAVSAMASVTALTFLLFFWYALPQYFKKQREQQVNTARSLSGQI